MQRFRNRQEALLTKSFDQKVRDKVKQTGAAFGVLGIAKKVGLGGTRKKRRN